MQCWYRPVDLCVLVSTASELGQRGTGREEGLHGHAGWLNTEFTACLKMKSGSMVYIQLTWEDTGRVGGSMSRCKVECASASCAERPVAGRETKAKSGLA